MKTTGLSKIALVVVSMGLVLSACGSNEGRPSVDEVAKALTPAMTEYGLPKEYSAPIAKCAATALVKSKVSNDALNKLVDADPQSSKELESVKVKEADRSIMETALKSQELTDCATKIVQEASKTGDDTTKPSDLATP